ncbi:MAG: DEAD/DEAH box helicase [Victivallaceae bacterium]|nr:DEAD/DEAH box helicase [Victivallaceae bacterium]
MNILGTIRRFFGGEEKKLPDESRKKRPAKKNAPKTADPASPKKRKGIPPVRKPSGANNSAPSTRAATVPPHPAELRDVPVVEGKMRFLDLALHRDVQFGVQAAGFEYCTPIQALALPILLEKRDLAARAQTGTGKTAAFLLAAFTDLLNHPLAGRKKRAPRILVLAPTRELAVQIHKDAEQLGVYTSLTKEVVFGGMDHEKQRRALDKNLDLLVGTPGRVIDYSQSGDLDLSQVEILVIDEADRMLDMGFIPDVKRIVSRLPKKGERQTLLFSATLDESILRLSSGWLAEPAVVESEPEKLVSEHIRQQFYSVLRDEKLSLLLYLLAHEKYERVIIFGNRKDVNLRLQSDLARFGYSVPVLSGDIAQEKRIRILEKFRSGEEKIVIATDVAARGIHVDDVSMVINYDLPERAEDYIHRIGRTGRAGHDGIAVSFLCEYGAYYLPAIEEMLKTQFHSTLPSEEMLRLPEEVPGAAHRFETSGRRPSKRGSSGGRGRRR